MTNDLACERAQREKKGVCACGEVSVHPPSRSWQLPLSGRETARKNKNESEKCARLQMGPDSGELDNN